MQRQVRDTSVDAMERVLYSDFDEMACSRALKDINRLSPKYWEAGGGEVVSEQCKI